MIERYITKQVLASMAYFPAVAILGARQVGKTTFSRMLTNRIIKPIVYLDLENPEDEAKLQNPVRFLEANQNCCVVLDEVQRMPELFPVLRSVIDTFRVPGRFILLGSASPDLLRKSSESLAGRIALHTLDSFNLKEIHHLKSIEDHWLSGGFPNPFLINDSNQSKEWYRHFILTCIEKDLPNLGLKTETTQLRQFFYMLAHSHGSLVNKSNFGKALEVNRSRIQEYFHYLEYAYLIRLLQPFHFNLKKRLVKSPKTYFKDSGMLHHLLRIYNYNDLLGHPILGHSWEGYVIEQIISVLGTEYEYFFYRTQDGAECDLILTQGYLPVASIEIKFTDSPKKTKSFTTACQDLGTKQNFLIVPRNEASYPIADNMWVCGLDAFLNEFHNTNSWEKK